MPASVATVQGRYSVYAVKLGLFNWPLIWVVQPFVTCNSRIIDQDIYLEFPGDWMREVIPGAGDNIGGASRRVREISLHSYTADSVRRA